jgi:hypothetical protein
MGKLDSNGTVHDYNGEGRWTVNAVQERYAEYCHKLGGEVQSVPTAREHQEGQSRWVYPVMEAVIAGIERDDKASIAIGIDFIEDDTHFPFGKTLKSNTARALRRASLTPQQVGRIRNRVTNLLLAGHIPHEFREYAKLLRHVGIAECWPRIERATNLDNPYVKRYFEYFRQCAQREAGT